MPGRTPGRLFPVRPTGTPTPSGRYSDFLFHYSLLPGLGPHTALALVRHCLGDQKSNSELRRLFRQGAVAHNTTTIDQPDQSVDVRDGDVVRVGRRTWFRLRRP